MSFLQTTATDYNDLISKLHTFAVTTDGWTSVYNATTDEGSERQIGIEKSNCHIAIGARNTENPIARSPSGTDAIVNMALATALLSGAGQKRYYATTGHTGSLVTTATDADRILINDLGEPPFANVWFFSAGGAFARPYVNCVVQTSGERYVHFGFGIVDPLGMTHANVAYAVSGYYEWWPNGTGGNDPAAGVHSIGHIGESESQVYVPAGVLPAGYPASAVFASTQLSQTMERVRTPADQWAAQVGNILDLFFAVNNQPTTGGTALFALPVLFQEQSSGTSHIWLGILPDVKLASIGNHTPGETLKFGSEEWLIFPWKRKGLRENLVGGGNPVATANTAEYAFAYKKIP